jgi:putative peptidoglycan lipid II flippase
MTQADADNTPDRHEQEHFFSAARSVAGLTMASRVLGFVRDMVLVPLGVPAVADVFWTAFGIPHMFRRLFGEGALSAAFVPVFTDAAETGGPDRARKVLANTAGLLAVVLTVLVMLIGLGLAAWLALGGAHMAAKAQLTIDFTMIMLPFAIFICLLALCSAALNAKGHFAYPAAAPILLNVGLIFTAVVLAPAIAAGDVGRFRVVGAALVACSVAQLAGAIWLLRRSGLGGRWHVRPMLPEMRQIAWRMLPTMLPLGLVQIGDQLMRIIALALTRTEAAPWLPLLPGVVRGQYLSGRLYQLPLGVLAVSIATAVFPLMSRCAARGDLPGLRDAVNRALRLCLFLSIPSGVALIILALPTIAAGFQRGDFTAEDSAMTARMLQMYCLGMPAYFCTHILLRAFFSRKDTRTPMYAAVTCTALSLAMVCAGIYTPLRSAALGLATSVAAGINVVWLLVALHRKVGKLGMRSLLTSSAKTAAATAAMAAAIFAAQWALGAAAQRWLPLNENLGRVAVLAGAILAGSATFLAAARMLACRELGELVRRPAKAQ